MRKLITVPLSEYKGLLAKVSTLEASFDQLKLQHQTVLDKYNQLVTDYDKVREENRELKEIIVSLQNQIFGKKKDRIKKSADIRDINKVRREKVGGKKGRKPIDPEYKADEVRSYDYASNPMCSICRLMMQYISSSSSHHVEYEVILKRVKIEQAIYACRCCNKITVARGHKAPIDKGLPLPGLLTQTVLDKFSNGMPMYRQAQNYGYMGINYSRQLISNWFSRASDIIEPLYNIIFEEIINSNYIMADETPITLLNMENKAPGSKGYVTVIKQGGKKIFNFVYCWVIGSRSQEIITKKLAKYKGNLQVDGLSFYNQVLEQSGVIYVACWSHVRRKFTDIIKLSGKLEGIAYEIVEKIDKLYKIEHRGAGLDKKGLLKLRQKEAVSILKELKKYLSNIEKTTLPKGKLGVAIKYTLDRWGGLMQYTENADLEIDNNATERCIKHVVMGRKNWLFADNINSANKLAMLYSLIITCKINNINPREYLEYIFTQLPYINKHDTSELRKLLPDKYDVNKRYDEEYRERAGIIEMISIPTIVEGVQKVA